MLSGWARSSKTYADTFLTNFLVELHPTQVRHTEGKLDDVSMCWVGGWGESGEVEVE